MAIFSAVVFFTVLLLFTLCCALTHANTTEDDLMAIAERFFVENNAELMGYALDNSDNETFNWSELVKAARFSSVSRCLTWNTKSIKNWTCKHCREKLPHLTDVTVGLTKNATVAWYCGYNAVDAQIICNARSSITIENWIADLDFKQVSYNCPDCMVHQGFLKAYIELRNEWLDAIDALKVKYADHSPQVTFTGHSLASAIMMHATLDVGNGSFDHISYEGKSYWFNYNELPYNELSLEEHEQIKRSIAKTPTVGTVLSTNSKYILRLPFYNFGGPRVGNPAFAGYFKSVMGEAAVYQARRSGDIVPSLPMRDTFGLKFQHPSREVYFPNGTNDYKLCNDNADEDKSCFIANIHLFITDHLIYAGQAMMQNPLDCL